MGEACTRTFTVPAGEARTGTGTISSSGGTVAGSGTAFTSELQVGDTLIYGDQRVAVRAIISDTSLLTDPVFLPALSAVSFTFSNPITKFLDANGAVLGLVDAQGLVAYGQSYATGPLTVFGLTETGAGLSGKPGNIVAGGGGPASVSSGAGPGGKQIVRSGQGGVSSFSGAAGGAGGLLDLDSGAGGDNTSGNGQGGTGGGIFCEGGDGGLATGTSAGSIGGNGGSAHVSGGHPGSGHTPGVAGDTFLCEFGGDLKIGGPGGAIGATQINCGTGGFTSIGGVPVSAFPPVNAAGVMKNDGAGNYSLSAVAGTDFATQTANAVFSGPTSGSAAAPTFRTAVMADLPAAARNAVYAFVHANAGGI